MDSTIEVALASKLSRLFPEDDDKFLVFFPSLAFTDSELELGITDDVPTADQIKLWQSNRNQFARLMNDVPGDAPIYTSSGRTLWVEYRSVLENAQPATNSLDGDEQAALAEAREFLVDSVEGVSAYSPALAQYYVYKDKYEELARIYQDELITAEASSDPADREAWERDREPELRSLRDQAMDEWQLLGLKDDIERRQATVRMLGGRDSTVQLQGLLNDLEASCEEDLLTNDPVGTYSTVYSPHNVFASESEWSSLHISKEEFSTLVAEAPEAFQGRVSDGAGAVQSLRIEYAKVVVIRPWFRPEYFESRSWRLAESEAPVSDGGIPRQGRITSYITNLIVVRKIEIDRLELADDPQSTNRDGASAEQLKLLVPGVLQLDHRLTVAVAGEVRRQSATPGRLASSVQVVKPAATAARPRRRATAKPPRRPTRRDHRKGQSRTTRDHRAATAPKVATGRRTETTARARNARAGRPNIAGQPTATQAVLSASTVARANVRVPSKRGRKRVVPKERRLVTETLEFDGVAVLGCVCRRLPLSPNPDESLAW